MPAHLSQCLYVNLGPQVKNSVYQGAMEVSLGFRDLRKTAALNCVNITLRETKVEHRNDFIHQPEMVRLVSV